MDAPNALAAQFSPDSKRVVSSSKVALLGAGQVVRMVSIRSTPPPMAVANAK